MSMCLSFSGHSPHYSSVGVSSFLFPVVVSSSSRLLLVDKGIFLAVVGVIVWISSCCLLVVVVLTALQACDAAERQVKRRRDA